MGCSPCAGCSDARVAVLAERPGRSLKGELTAVLSARPTFALAFAVLGAIESVNSTTRKEKTRASNRKTSQERCLHGAPPVDSRATHALATFHFQLTRRPPRR